MMRTGSEVSRVGGIHRRDEDRTEHLPRVVVRAGVLKVRHVERDRLEVVEDRAVGAQHRHGMGPVPRLARVEVVAVLVLAELDDARPAGPHVRLPVVAVVAGHEQDGQFAVDHVDLRRPEAAGHDVARRVGVSRDEQVDLPAATGRDRVVGQILDALGDADGHVGPDRRVGAVHHVVLSGDHDEDSTAVEGERDDRRVGPLVGERRRVQQLPDEAAHPLGAGGRRVDRVPFDGAGGRGAVGVRQLNAGQ